MKVLALEPYFGGSHRAFLEGWQQYSRHDFTVLGLPPFKWKWRMRHSAVTFAQQLAASPLLDQRFDVLWCSDMLNLAEFVGLAPEPIRQLPRVAYFHENQLTYPVREEKKRDLHFTYSNFTTCLVADQIWFNSVYHREDFTQSLAAYLSRMPDYQSTESVSGIAEQAIVQSPGITPFPPVTAREPGPLRIGWNARWEYDKNPTDFFAALRILRARGVPFQLIVLGESYRNTPPIFQAAEREFAEETIHWGFAPSHDDYRQLLQRADVLASTAIHEFFGIGVVEAIAAGVIPLVPNRLAYPEVVACCDAVIESTALLYGQSAGELATAISKIADRASDIALRQALQDSASRFRWEVRASEMDDELDDDSKR